MSVQNVGFYTLKYLVYVIITGLQMHLLSAKQGKEDFESKVDPVIRQQCKKSVKFSR
jgi:phage-related protein